MLPHLLERLRCRGPQALDDAELLQVLLGRGGVRLLHERGGLSAVLTAPPTGSPLTSQQARIVVVLELARRHYAAAMRSASALGSSAETRQFLRAQLRDRPYEVFCCIYLDNRHRVIAFEELFRGTIDGAAVHPREVVRQALAHNAAALILAHNHPSGVAEPSRADELITLRLRDALALIDVRVLDHLIVAGGDTLSLAERGLL